MWFPHIAIDLVFVLDMVILYFLAIRFRWNAIVCRSSSVVAIKRYNFYNIKMTGEAAFADSVVVIHYIG